MTRQPTSADQPAVDVPVNDTDAQPKALTPGLGALFNPAAMAKARAATQARAHQPGKPNHDQTPGPAPHGTRKSMGKR